MTKIVNTVTVNDATMTTVTLLAAKFGVFVDEDHSKLPTLYCLPKRHNRPYKSRFTANSLAHELLLSFSLILTSFLTAML